MKETEEKFAEIIKHNPDEVSGGLEITRECEYKRQMKNLTDYEPPPAERLQSRYTYKAGFTELLGTYTNH